MNLIKRLKPIDVHKVIARENPEFSVSENMMTLHIYSLSEII